MLSSYRAFAYLRIALLQVLMFTVPAPTVHAQAVPAQRPPTEPAEPSKAAVVVKGKKLFEVRERVLSFSPEDRARAISERIQKLSKDPLLKINSITTGEGEASTDIVAGDLVIMTVTERDAKAAGRARQELASEYAGIIRTTLETLRRTYSARTILIGILFALLATTVLVLLLKLLGIVFPRLYAKLDAWKGTRIRSLRIQKLELLPADRITTLLIGLAKAARIAAVLILFYFYLPLVFSFFPWTRGYAATLFHYVLSPLRLVGQALISYLPNLFFVVVILVVSYYLIKFIKFIFAEIGKGTIQFPGFYPEWADPTFKIARFLVIAFTAIIVFPYLPGSRSPAFQGVSIFLGVLFSLGSTAAVANVVAGVILTYTRAFATGDRVKIGDTTGDVVERTLLVTRIRTIKNEEISVPNSIVLGSHIINFSSSAPGEELIMHTSVTISYDVPWRKVHQLLKDAALATEHILKEPAPFVLQTSLDDFYVTYELNAHTDKPNLMAVVYSELHQNIQDKFNEAGVEIMSPHYSALREGNQAAVPSSYLPKTYTAPAFRIHPLENPFKKPDEKGT